MVDFDNIFKFCTPKYVYIRDAKLGIMKYSTMLAIFVYVVIYEIFYTCDHLAPHHAMGFGTISMQHPVDNCNEMDKDCLAKWHNIATLPYCSQYIGDKDEKKTARLLEEKEDKKEKKDEGKEAKDSEEDGKDEKKDSKADKKEETYGKPITKQKMCRYLDNRRLEWSSGTPSEIFIPTHYRQITQKTNPDCYNPALDKDTSSADASKFRCKSPYTTTDTQDYFIADIERYTLKMSHSFSSPVIGKFGVSTDFQGLFAACPNNHPKDIATDCKRVKIPGTSGAIAPEDASTLVSQEDIGISTLKGAATGEDVISVADLLRTCPVAQKFPKVRENVLDAELPKDFGHEGKSLREAGGMLLLDVDYSNNGYLRPGIPLLPSSLGMDIKPITYMYRPYFVPTNKNEKFQLVEESDHAEERVIDIWYGLTIKMQFNGQLVVFTWSKVLKALTAGLVLLSMASTLVVSAASYILPMNEKYNALMYQMSEDMSNFKEMRGSRVSCLGNIINPLGLLDGSEAWAKMQSTFCTGSKLWEHVAANGEPSKEMVNADIVKILCMNEVRLNRLDAMDTRVLFGASDEEQRKKNRIGVLTTKMEEDYYNVKKSELRE